MSFSGDDPMILDCGNVSKVPILIAQHRSEQPCMVYSHIITFHMFSIFSHVLRFSRVHDSQRLCAP